MKPKSPPATGLSPRLQIFHALQSLFATYPQQACLYLSAQNRDEWMVLIRSQGKGQLYDFEQYFDRIEKRDAYNREHFERLLKEVRPHRDRFGGCIDFFAPVTREGRCEGFLMSGSFREKCWTVEELRGRWKEISGAEGSDLNPDFVRFARTALDLPVLDEAGLDGYGRLLGLLARWLAGEEEPGMLEEIGRLGREVFAPRLPHPYWVDWTLGIDKFNSRGGKIPDLFLWERQEMGITRPPTVVAALMPQPSGPRGGLVSELCRARSFQHEAFLAARRFPETVAGPLGDYGCLLLFSPKPGVPSAQARLEVRDHVQAFRKEMEKKFNTTVLAGVGSIQPKGSELLRSYRDAVAGLHLAVQSGQNPSFVVATEGEREGVPTAGLRASMREMADALTRASQGRLAIARDKFVRQVLFASHGQSETVRHHFLSALHILLERFEARSGVSLGAARTLGDDLADRVAQARNLPDLMSSFTGALEALERYQEKPREAVAAARVEEVLKDLEAEPGKNWKLSGLCKRTGMSAPTFLKWFKQLTGTGFGPHLRRARLTKAKQMLQEGHLTLDRIALECGFNSASYFIQAFKRAQGTSPRKYKGSK